MKSGHLKKLFLFIKIILVFVGKVLYLSKDKQQQPNTKMFIYIISDNFNHATKAVNRAEALQAMKDGKTHIYTNGIKKVKMIGRGRIGQSNIFKTQTN